MNIVITGASGFIGKQLIPLLNFKKSEIYIFGRDIKKLRNIFPNFNTYTYENLEKILNEDSIILHLAVKNNNNNNNRKYLKDFIKTNITDALKIYDIAIKSNIRHFINISSINVLDDKKKDPYTLTKKKFIKRLKSKKKIEVINLFLPIVYGESFSGKLSILNRLTFIKSNFLIKILSAIKPAININSLALFINQKKFDNNYFDNIISDGQINNIIFQIFKRTTDILLSILILSLLGWLIIIISILVKLSSKGPAIFTQNRIGKNGLVFKCFKFRTMKLDTAILATHEVSSNQITWMGKALRKTKLDEIPQIINVLKGELSFVGPRPCLPSQEDLIKNRKKNDIMNILPGITGLAQINGIDMSDPLRLTKVDYQYVKLQSIWLDIKIILLTLIGKGLGDKIKKLD